LEMTDTEIWVMGVATVLGPILAVQTQKWIERASERRRMRTTIFQSLMSNRAARLHDDFIRALNMIDLEFSPKRFRGSKDKVVIDAWRTLRGEYNAAPDEGASLDEMKAWNTRVGDRLVALLSAMSKALDYGFSEEELRRGIYYPKGRAELEQTQNAILAGLQALLEGAGDIKMRITEFPSSPDFTAAQLAMMKASVAAYGDDGALRVQLAEKPAPKAFGSGL
jgi:hypothetical protein